MCWAKHPVAKKCLKNHRNFIAGKGFKVVATGENPEIRNRLQALINEWWDINCWDDNLAQRVETLSVEGEWIYWAPPPDLRGMWKMSKILPENVSDIGRDAIDAELLDTVFLKSELVFQENNQLLNMKQLKVVRRNHRSGRIEGDCLYLGINRLSGQSRGFSDLLAVFDYLDTFDNLVFLESERVNLQRSFAWKVHIKGSANEEKILARKEEIEADGPPAPGEILIQNDDEDWSTLSPQLNLAETIEFIRMVQNIILGGLDTPQHWFSEGGDVNKATSQEMGGPAYAVVRQRNQEIECFLALALDLCIQRWSEAGELPEQASTADLTYQIVSRDPEPSDSREDALSKLTATMVLGEQNNYFSHDEAARTVRASASQHGLGDFPGLPPENEPTAPTGPTQVDRPALQEPVNQAAQQF